MRVSPRATARIAARRAGTGSDLSTTAVGARRPRRERQCGAGVGRVDDHARRIGATLEASAEREPVTARQVVVQDDDVDAATVEPASEIVGTTGRGDDGEIRFGFDEPSQAGEHGRVIIEKRDLSTDSVFIALRWGAIRGPPARRLHGVTAVRGRGGSRSG